MTGKPRASRLETLGAWLHVWTPPRDVIVPPVPWRKVAIGAGVLLLLGVFTALVIAPAVDDAKDRSAAEERAAEDRRRAARRAHLRSEQRARLGPLPRTEPLAAVEALIGRDARARFDTDGRPASCETAPGEDGGGPRVVYDCFATVREIRGAGDQDGATGALAIPYRAVLDLDGRRYAFCKINPHPGEAAIAAAEEVVELPPACRARRDR